MDELLIFPKLKQNEKSGTRKWSQSQNTDTSGESDGNWFMGLACWPWKKKTHYRSFPPIQTGKLKAKAVTKRYYLLTNILLTSDLKRFIFVKNNFVEIRGEIYLLILLTLRNHSIEYPEKHTELMRRIKNVKIENSLSNKFPIQQDMRQGCILSQSVLGMVR